MQTKLKKVNVQCMSLHTLHKDLPHTGEVGCGHHQRDKYISKKEQQRIITGL